jgi:uncharacterized membrane protein
MSDNNGQRVMPPPGPRANGTGLQENFAATLCYAFLPAPWVGGMVMYLIEPNKKFVRFHAVQSILVFGLLTIIVILLGPLVGAIYYLGYLLSSLFGLAWFVLWLVLLVRAYQGLEWRAPVLGNLAARWTGR